jgi:hypothetical protein
VDLDEPRDDEICVRVVSGSGADITLSSAAAMTRGRSLRGVMGGDLAPTALLPRLLDLRKRGRFRLAGAELPILNRESRR